MAVSAVLLRQHVPLVAFVAALLAAAACSPDPAHSARERAQDIRARPAAALASGTVREAQLPRTSGQIQRAIVARDGSSTVSAAAITDRRCGWLSNPTPGNWWLFDGHGEWILATQGGDRAAGFDDMPDMSTAGWVETNGHYGYGCACMTLTHHPNTLQVARIAAVRPKPLKQCRADRKLPRH